LRGEDSSVRNYRDARVDVWSSADLYGAAATAARRRVRLLAALFAAGSAGACAFSLLSPLFAPGRNTGPASFVVGAMLLRLGLLILWSAVVGIPIALLCTAVPALRELAVLLLVLVWGIGGVVVLPAWASQIAERRRGRDVDVVLDVMRTVSVAKFKAEREIDFRNRILERIRDTIAPGSAQAEHPLVAKTDLDGYFEYAGRSWFVSMKISIDSRQRKLMQGDAEDVIRTLESRDWVNYDGEPTEVCILLVVVLPAHRTLTQSDQLTQLQKYADSRMAQMIHKNRLTSPFSIEVIQVTAEEQSTRHRRAA
jgi:hypothetical protein